MTYSYDRRRFARSPTEHVLRDMVRWIDNYKDRAWRIYAYDQADWGSPAAEYILNVFGKDIYNLTTRGGQDIIPVTNDAGKIKRYLSNYVELDWEPTKHRPRPKSDKPFWRLWS